MRKSWKRLAALLLCALLCVTSAAGAEKKQVTKNETGIPSDGAPASQSEEEPLTYFDLSRFASEKNDPGSGLKEKKPGLPEVPWNSLALEGIETGSGRTPRSQASSARMTVQQLRAKYTAGKYWNHANNPGAESERNNADSWTETPCSAHDLDEYWGSGVFTCNVQEGGYQCHGYALKLGLDATGQDPENWAKIGSANAALSVVRAGDIFRLSNSDGSFHTIFVIAVRGQEVMYTDCNSDNACVISWGSIMTKGDIQDRFVYMLRSPMEVPWGGDGACWCDADLAGQYTTKYQVNLLSGHGEDYDPVATLPAGITVQVTRGDEYWMHAECQGYSGYLPSGALKPGKGEKPTIHCDWSWLLCEIPDNQTMDFLMTCSGNLPERYSIYTSVSEGKDDFFRLDFVAWEGQDAKFQVTGLAPGECTLTFQLVDYNTKQVVTACDVLLRVKVEETTLTSKVKNISLKKGSSKTITLKGGGYIPDVFYFTLWAWSGDCFQIDWSGKWKENAHDVKIKGVRTGSGRAVFALVCRDTVLVSLEVYITVTADESSDGDYVVDTARNVAYFKAPADRNATSLTIADTVQSDGVRVKVVGILDNACQGMTRLKEVTIGKNVKTIGKKAFYGCKALKKITFKTSSLRKDGVGKNAFKGIASQPTVKCPSSVRKTYQKILKDAGMPKKATYK